MPSKAFSDVQGLPCLSLTDLDSLVQCQPLPHFLSTPVGSGLLFGLYIEILLFLGMFLPTILFQMTLFIAIKTTDILIFLILEITSIKVAS